MQKWFAMRLLNSRNPKRIGIELEDAMFASTTTGKYASPLQLRIKYSILLNRD